MPELPEVETTRRGIEPHVLDHTIESIKVYQKQLRWPIPTTLKRVTDHNILGVGRRGKYLLLSTVPGTVIIHLGMSGSLRISEPDNPLRKHDHVEFLLSNGVILRYHDPRRFGCILFHPGDPHDHALLRDLGPEPLSTNFDGEHLFRQSRKKKSAVKNFIMDSHVVVGVGNIYASESLFLSGVRPGRAACRVTREQYQLIAANIKRVLDYSIKMGGTTLRDFVNSDGEPGYFKQRLNVYGREGSPCRQCQTTIKNKTIGQRSSFYCPNCQH
ncbi:MAG: bifunctional DNA-formamidopyrimidine glycosylase/DNA-(apurinic or apyrimidinic site) lyase [Granulosicoccus sp.]|nr:bifunctional DNA-formamidopyrimidine glycosylase/DNA-(apurinic or apyrimidinic site) lyase [Granulosicoccus sp.]